MKPFGLKRLLRNSSYAVLLLIMILAFFTVAANGLVFRSQVDRVYKVAANVPERDVAVVLGTSRYVSRGRENLYFRKRIDAAVELYQLGRVRHILVSGDNRHKYHNEPRDMLNALREAGIPRKHITLDYAGFRTLDSVYRAKQIFAVDRAVLVTQRYHSYRALFLSEHAGLEAIAYAAEGPKSDRHQLSAEFREYLARIKAVLDVYLLGRKPHHLGDIEPIIVDE